MIKNSLPVIQPVENGSPESKERTTPTCCGSVSSSDAPQSVWAKSSLTRIVLSVYLTGIALVAALVINTTGEITAPTKWWLQALLIGVTTVTLALLGPDFVAGSWSAAKKRQASLEGLILIAMLGAFAYSLASVIRGTGAVYFEVICVLLIIYASGRRLKTRARATALKNASSWKTNRLVAKVVTENGIIEPTEIEQVRAGQVVIVYPGQMIPVDGVIVSGIALIRQSALTGESLPVTRGLSSAVFAGTICIDATLKIEASCAGNRRVVDQIQNAVFQARQTSSQVEDLTQRVAKWFLPFVAGIALATALVWGLSGNLDAAFLNASAVLLVACPCALGLATPIAVWAALSELAGLGLVAKHGDAVLALAKVDFACFDKTGTLTSSDPQSVRLRKVDDHAEGTVVATISGATTVQGTKLLTSPVTENLTWDESEIKSIVSTVERSNEHPVALVLRDLSPPTSRFQTRDVRILPGRGIECLVEDVVSKRLIEVEISKAGNGQNTNGKMPEAEFVESVENYVPELVKSFDESGVRSKVLTTSATENEPHRLNVYFNKRRVAEIKLSETVPDMVPQMFANLNSMGIETAILSGDSQGRVNRIDASVGHGEMTSGDKRRFVEAQKQSHTVLFVGDGFNDAEAMAASDVSIAAAWGTDFASETADVVWLQRDGSSIVAGVMVCRQARSVIISNLFLAATYNVVGISLAATGYLHPIAAAILMLASSLTVTLRASSINVR